MYRELTNFIDFDKLVEVEQSKANRKRSTNMVTKVNRVKRIFHYNLQTSTQEDFNTLLKHNKKKEVRVAVNPMRRSLGQLTPSNVLTIKGYYDVKGKGVNALRVRVYKYAKDLGITVETAFSKDKNALLVRLKRNWPVGVDRTAEV